jgi:hypothetical protein
MQIQVKPDHDTPGREALAAHVEGVVEDALARFGSHVTRVEVRLGDPAVEEAGLGEKRCSMEARVEGRQPSVVTCVAATVKEAVAGAADKLEQSVERALEQ